MLFIVYSAQSQDEIYDDDADLHYADSYEREQADIQWILSFKTTNILINFDRHFPIACKYSCRK